MDKRTEKLIVKFLSKEANLEELHQLELWIHNPKNEALFYEFIKTNALANRAMSKYNKESAKEKIALRIKQERSIFYRRKKTNTILKYAAVASVAIIVTLTVLFNRDNTTEIVEPVIVDTKIEPGTDKATLTLGDGSQISLEKGASFQTQNASSNGAEIVYDSGKQSSKKLVYNYLTIPRGGQFHIVLSDGTRVWLNSESQLKYPVAFVEGETRQVELVYGEAYFDVSPSAVHKGAKFKVHNAAQDIEVMGTEFNIKAYKDESNIYTTLVEGKVAISAVNTSKTLEPNEQLNLNKITNDMEVTDVDVYRVISWKEGVFSFRNKSLKEIMKVISRWYDTEVIFHDPALETVTFNGSLDKKLSIEDILSIIGNTNDIQFEINEKTIILK
ncbi:FecR family protein [Seonamhaeicola sp.]|uniref:FecR family protein n=1 Tax=Seonamhaeicola sp. TaxID=1912245 RepID=UPI002619144E|nr:FecR family protein [Seonamhaeicola sp.]